MDIVRLTQIQVCAGKPSLLRVHYYTSFIRSAVLTHWVTEQHSLTFSFLYIVFISVVDSLHSDPEPSRKNQTGQMVHAVWWWWEAEAHWGGSCCSDCPRCQTHQLRRGKVLLSHLLPLPAKTNIRMQICFWILCFFDWTLNVTFFFFLQKTNKQKTKPMTTICTHVPLLVFSLQYSMFSRISVVVTSDVHVYYTWNCQTD